MRLQWIFDRKENHVQTLISRWKILTGLFPLLAIIRLVLFGCFSSLLPQCLFLQRTMVCQLKLNNVNANKCKY